MNPNNDTIPTITFTEVRVPPEIWHDLNIRRSWKPSTGDYRLVLDADGNFFVFPNHKPNAAELEAILDMITAVRQPIEEGG